MYLFSGNQNKVIVPKDEVNQFRAVFPCSGLRDRSYWFEFDSQGGLVDTDVPEQDDGEGAAVLCDDARVFWENCN